MKPRAGWRWNAALLGTGGGGEGGSAWDANRNILSSPFLAVSRNILQPLGALPTDKMQ